MARRFIAPDKDIKIEEDILELVGNEAKHINVLRHVESDQIIINEFVCEILEINKKSIKCKVIGKAKENGVPNIKITLFQSLLKADKMDFVIQKAVEIGASEIQPMESKNIVVKLDEKDKIKKVERYNKISIEASKQCGRTDIVEVKNIIKLDTEVEEKFKEYDAVFFAYEAEEKSLRNAINKIKKEKSNNIKNIAIIIGPEGGFTKEEIEAFSGITNVYMVSLGERILRAETASLNLLSILVYEMDL